MFRCAFWASLPRVVFTIKLAGIPIEVHALHYRTKLFCRKYLADELPLITVSIFQDDIRKERELDAEQMKKEGHSHIWYPASYLETLALCRKIMAELITHDILLFHGAVMAYDGKAYLFTAKSGTGKTTHCRLWLRNIADCHILNGDKPLLMLKDGKTYVCGSPWQGKENYGVNEILPLEAVCLLERDKTNHIERIALKDSFETLINQCHVPEGIGNFVKTVNIIKHMSDLKLYRLGCNMEDDAARVAFKTMCANN